MSGIKCDSEETRIHFIGTFILQAKPDRTMRSSQLYFGRTPDSNVRFKPEWMEEPQSGGRETRTNWATHGQEKSQGTLTYDRNHGRTSQHLSKSYNRHHFHAPHSPPLFLLQLLRNICTERL